MASTNLARLQDNVRLNVPGALDGMIRLACFDVLKEFFQRSNAWLLELPVQIIPVVNDYQLHTGQNLVVNRLMWTGRLNPVPTGMPPFSYLPMCPPQFLASMEGGAASEAQNPLMREKRNAVLLNAGSRSPILRIEFNPGANEIWVATVACTPCDPTDKDGFVDPPDWVMEKYLSYISSGVASKLMLQPGKSYSSVQGAQYHGRKLNEGIGLARTEMRHMFVFDGQSWKFPGGWKSSRPNLSGGVV